MAVRRRPIPTQYKEGTWNHWGCLKMKQTLNGGQVWLSLSHDQTSFLQSRVTVSPWALITSYLSSCSSYNQASTRPVSSLCHHPAPRFRSGCSERAEHVIPLLTFLVSIYRIKYDRDRVFFGAISLERYTSPCIQTVSNEDVIECMTSPRLPFSELPLCASVLT